MDLSALISRTVFILIIVVCIFNIIQNATCYLANRQELQSRTGKLPYRDLILSSVIMFISIFIFLEYAQRIDSPSNNMIEIAFFSLLILGIALLCLLYTNYAGTMDNFILKRTCSIELPICPNDNYK